ACEVAHLGYFAPNLMIAIVMFLVVQGAGLLAVASLDLPVEAKHENPPRKAEHSDKKREEQIIERRNMQRFLRAGQMLAMAVIPEYGVRLPEQKIRLAFGRGEFPNPKRKHQRCLWHGREPLADRRNLGLHHGRMTYARHVELLAGRAQQV